MNHTTPYNNRSLPAFVLALSAVLWVPCEPADVAVAAPQKGALPEVSAFLRIVRDRLETIWPPPLDASYCVRWLDGGHSGEPRKWIYEVRPAAAHLDVPPYWRLLVDANKPVAESELARRDREQSRRIAEQERQQQTESASARARRERETAVRRERVRTDVDDLFRAYDVRMEGRVSMNGRPALIFALTPRQRVPLRGRYATILPHARARAWIDEQEHEVIRLEGTLIEDATVALGLVARVHRDTGGVFVRQRLDNGRWVPAEARLTGSVRRLLVDVKRLDMDVRFFGYAFGRERPAEECRAEGASANPRFR
jgi:hypothetical protein